MRRTMWLAMSGLGAILLARSDVTEARGPAEDDLAVVRRAVAQNTPPPSAAKPVDERVAERPATAGRKSSPQWLRIRVTERGGKKVAVNVPLALARAFGDDIPIHLGCRRHPGDDERPPVRLGDILKSLDSGQEIVEVDSDDAKVRVWVE